jgi:pyruvate dehydrogenase E1 component alpha subunit
MSAPADAAVDRATLLRLYESMTAIRGTDERLRRKVMSGQWAVFIHSARGQEAISAGVAAALNPDDFWVTTYRGMNDIIAKGCAAGPLYAEYLGKAGGHCKGKGGPFHVTDTAHGLMANSGIVGGGLPISNGLALSSVLRGDGKVTVVSFGDGAANIGGFHESMNLASLWKLPVLFLCQNNQFAEHTAVADHQVLERISDRASGYGMPGITVDGNDPVAVYDVARDAIARARAGDGPTMIEAVTYRLDGHYIGEAPHKDDAYKAALANDPVPKFRTYLLDTAGFSEADLGEVDERVAADLDAAVEYAEASPMPEPDERNRDIYAAVSTTAGAAR